MSLKSLGLQALSAIFAFVALTASAQGDVGTLIAQGDALDAKLDNAQALQVYLKAEELAPKDADVLYRIARQYALSMNDTKSAATQRDLGETALAYAKRAVAANPDNSNAQLSVAICYGRLVSFVDTRTKVEYSRLIKEHADTALKLNPKDSYAWHVLGVWNYEIAGMGAISRGFVRVIYGGMPPASYEDAARLLSKAVALAPDRVSHHVELGRVYLALGMKDQARTELQRGLALPSREKDDPESKRRATEALREI